MIAPRGDPGMHEPKQRRPQFSLRTLLIAAYVAGACLAAIIATRGRALVAAAAIVVWAATLTPVLVLIYIALAACRESVAGARRRPQGRARTCDTSSPDE